MKRIAVLLFAAACHGDAKPPPPPVVAPAPDAAVAIHTPKEFYALGTPTFVVGTAGDSRTTAGVRGQAAMIRALAFPAAELVDDTTITSTWPPHPVVYGGTHTNRAIAALGARLPFAITAGHLEIGGKTFDGDDYALVTVVPAAPSRAYPELLLYAGTGTPGVAEINTVANMDAAITVADAFGPLVTGTWTLDADGEAHAALGPVARRIGWREVAPPSIHGVAARFRFWDHAKPSPADDVAIAACTAGVATSADKLGAGGQLAVTIYVHPDRGTKRELTGNGGDGHAVPFARALHVVGTVGPGLEGLVAHEVTHVLAAQAWGQPGSALFAEGLAVWVSGRYGGQTLDELAASKLPPPPSTHALIGATFRKLPERTAYAYGALLVRATIGKLGLAAVRDHLYGATAGTWTDACRAAGTTPQELDALLATAIAAH